MRFALRILAVRWWPSFFGRPGSEGVGEAAGIEFEAGFDEVSDGEGLATGEGAGVGDGDAVTDGETTGEEDARGETDGVGAGETDGETVAEGEGDAVGEGEPFIIDPTQRPNRRTPEKAMAFLGDIVDHRLSLRGNHGFRAMGNRGSGHTPPGQKDRREKNRGLRSR